MRAAIVFVLAAMLSLAACKSAPAVAPLAHPYKIVLLPIEGAQSALAVKPGESDVPLALTPQQLEQQITKSVQDSHVFSDVIVASAADLKSPGIEDELVVASQLAKRTASDLILRIQVKSARMTDTGNNGSTFWSTLTWFMIPLPTWFVDDRTYDTDIKVQAELYEPDDPVKPTASVVATSDKQDLDLWDRGLSPLVLIVPPPFLKGSDATVSETLTERAVQQLLAALVEELRTREIPSRFDVFDLKVADGGGALTLTIGSRRRLRSLEVEVDGKNVQTWAETALVEDKSSTADRFVYQRTVPLQAKAGASVRVIATDEAGIREVRTLLVGGKR